MEKETLEELVHEGTVTNPGAIRVAQGMRDLPGFDDPLGSALSALAFAADKHRNQRRQDAQSSPYINHPIALTQCLRPQGRECRSRSHG